MPVYHGKSLVTPIIASPSVSKMIDIQEFNPNHDPKSGEFASGTSIGGGKQAEQKDVNITHWDNILTKNLHGPGDASAKDRLRRYMGSIMLGRDFNEDSAHYLERTGKRAFYDWASKKLGMTSR